MPKKVKFKSTGKAFAPGQLRKQGLLTGTPPGSLAAKLKGRANAITRGKGKKKGLKRVIAGEIGNNKAAQGVATPPAAPGVNPLPAQTTATGVTRLPGRLGAPGQLKQKIKRKKRRFLV